MYIERNLSLKVSKGLFGSTNHYYLDEEVTILTNKDIVLEGKITSIQDKGLMLESEEGNITIVLYVDIKDIANTDWLGGVDIREVNS